MQLIAISQKAQNHHKNVIEIGTYVGGNGWAARCNGVSRSVQLVRCCPTTQLSGSANVDIR